MILTQGFQQPFELDVTGVDDNHPVNWSVKTYPNPVQDHLNIRFTIRNPQDFTVVVMDITGKKVFVNKYMQVQPGEVKEIDMQQYHAGIYMISVTSQDQKVRRVYKISKK
ncbi:MAG: T9SS type A sorting domain-containing protein, partial [Bacteroidales bacterium]|nr:T9SS type A sorting domain-containing protein [Bacteroidales bacterium]